MKIYTKKGDSGYTSLFSGESSSKSSEVFDVLGSIDELNSSLGLGLGLLRDESLSLFEEIREDICSIQKEVMSLSAVIAGARLPEDKAVSLQSVKRLEMQCDKLDGILPELTNFILPSPPSASSAFHLSRAVCRRAERALVALFSLEDKNQSLAEDEQLSLIYFNRLSDYLFMLARYVSFQCKQEETIW